MRVDAGSFYPGGQSRAFTQTDDIHALSLSEKITNSKFEVVAMGVGKDTDRTQRGRNSQVA